MYGRMKEHLTQTLDDTIEAEDIPLTIVYEDDDLMVINKEAGMVVHPGCGNYHGTLVNAIALTEPVSTCSPCSIRAGRCILVDAMHQSHLRVVRIIVRRP